MHPLFLAAVTHAPDPGELPRSNEASEQDSALAVALSDGNRDAFESIVRIYHDALYRFIWLQVHNPDDTEDILQDIFTRLWDQRTRLTVHTSLRAYLYRSARNAVADRRKHAHVQETHQQQIDTDVREHLHNTPLPDVGAELEELRRALAEAIMRLPERTREVYLLCHQGGLKYADVAELVGISVKGVEFHMGKALKQLRESLERFAPE